MSGIAPRTIASQPWLAMSTSERARSTKSAIRVLAVALAITLAQIGICLVVSLAAGSAASEHAFQAFCRRDGFMYAAIASTGYQSTMPPTASVNFDESNVAFFPGYPLAGRLVQRLSGDVLPTHASLVVAAQLAAWGFWTYWLMMLRRLNVRGSNGALLTCAAALHPAAFFLVVGYSESLFLLALVGYLFWIFSSAPAAWWLAVPHGFVMTATRLGGLPLAFCPVVAQTIVTILARPAVLGQCRGNRRRIAQLATIAALASLGGLAFFAFCQGRFGAWDLYFQTQREGQGVTADWLWFARPSSYAFFGSVVHSHLNWTDDVSRLSVGLTVVLLLMVARKEWRLARSGDKGWRERIVLYLCAASLLFVHAAGVSPRHMQSMLRYCYPVHLLMLLALAQWAGSSSACLLEHRRARRWGIGFAIAGGALQLVLIYHYFRGGWVA